MIFKIHALNSTLKAFKHGDAVNSDPDAFRRSEPITERLVEHSHSCPGPS